jgi:cysteine synthase
VAAIKVARHFDLGPDDVIATVATDGAAMYSSEWSRLVREHFGGRFDEVTAGEVFGRAVLGATTDHLLELDARGRDRVFNLGYYTWVEQQGVSIPEFTARRSQAFWTGLRAHLDSWDALIDEFNARVGLQAA